MTSGSGDTLIRGENRFSVNLLLADPSLAKEIIPETAGVYFFEDVKGSVLYVGKAINLKRRLMSYLKPPLPLKIASMINKSVTFEFIVTRNEKEALLLEANLIKKFRPPYNVVLRDDKNYPSIRIDVKEPFPRLETVRRIKKDGAFYFGPYPSPRAMNDVVKILRKVFPLRKCPGRVFMKRHRPCINYDLGLCLAPCAGKISQKQYHTIVRDLIRFLNGDHQRLKEKLLGEMQQAADRLEFEKAATIRNRLFALDALMEKQAVISRRRDNKDVLGYFSDGEHAFISIVYVRSGIITGHKNFDVSMAFDRSRIFSSFISQYYDIYPFVPEEILTSEEVEDKSELENYLAELRGAAVVINCGGKNDEDRELIELALSNAKEHARATLSHSSSRLENLESLKDILGLSEIPQTVACVDISNLQGKHTIGAVVVFRHGVPASWLRRTYFLGEAADQNDPAMIQATIERLTTEEPSLFEEIDLLMVDGGRAQLQGALRAIENLLKNDTEASGLASSKNVRKVPVLIAIAKERGLDIKPERLLAEKLYLANIPEPILLSRHPKVRNLLQMIRDEAHRCALSAYQEEHRRALHASVLDNIKGVGPKRKKLLIKRFGDVESISQAKLEDLLAIPGIPEDVAKSIYEFFHSKR